MRLPRIEVGGDGPGPYFSIGVWGAAAGVKAGWMLRDVRSWSVGFDVWQRGEHYDEAARLLVFEAAVPWGRVEWGLTVKGT